LEEDVSGIRGPAPRPCESCPYRRDVPSGVWAADEYEKLPAFDAPTYHQPWSLFLCHQQNGRLCAGWVGCHDMDHSLALRLHASSLGAEVVTACLDYTSPVPLFKTGSEAATHGLAELERPGDGAQRVMSKISRRRP
jgi:hypothetical protein